MRRTRFFTRLRCLVLCALAALGAAALILACASPPASSGSSAAVSPSPAAEQTSPSIESSPEIPIPSAAPASPEDAPPPDIAITSLDLHPESSSGCLQLRYELRAGRLPAFRTAVLDFETATGGDRTSLTVSAEPDGLLTANRLDGLVTGALYRVRLRVGNVVSAPFSVTVPSPADILPPAGGELLAIPPTYQFPMHAPSAVQALRIMWHDATGPAAADLPRLSTGRISDWPIPTAARTAGTLPLEARWVWVSGALSTVWNVGTLRIISYADVVLLFPGPGMPTMVPEPAFFWTNAGSAVATLELRASRPGGVDSEAEQRVTGLKNGSSPGDLRRLVPGLSLDKDFWWRLRHADGTSSEWRMSRLSGDVPDFLPLVGSAPVSFPMGRSAGLPDQAPQRQVTLTKPVSLQRRAFTNRQFALLANAGIALGRAVIDADTLRSHPAGTVLAGLGKLDYGQQFGLAIGPDRRIVPVVGRDNHPVVGVSWEGAVWAAGILELIEGSGEAGRYRLPTEAEWEYAVTRGGTSASPWGKSPGPATANYLRSGDRFEDAQAPFTRNGGPTTPVDWYDKARGVGSAAATDLLGNVWNWCSDWYLPDGYGADDLSDPCGPELLPSETAARLAGIGQLPSRVVRGGAWNSPVTDLDPRMRGKYPPGKVSHSVGFRLAREDSPGGVVR